MSRPVQWVRHSCGRHVVEPFEKRHPLAAAVMYAGAALAAGVVIWVILVLVFAFGPERYPFTF